MENMFQFGGRKNLSKKKKKDAEVLVKVGKEIHNQLIQGETNA